MIEAKNRIKSIKNLIFAFKVIQGH